MPVLGLAEAVGRVGRFRGRLGGLDGGSQRRGQEDSAHACAVGMTRFMIGSVMCRFPTYCPSMEAGQANDRHMAGDPDGADKSGLKVRPTFAAGRYRGR